MEKPLILVINFEKFYKTFHEIIPLSVDVVIGRSEKSIDCGIGIRCTFFRHNLGHWHWCRLSDKMLSAESSIQSKSTCLRRRLNCLPNIAATRTQTFFHSEEKRMLLMLDSWSFSILSRRLVKCNAHAYSCNKGSKNV